MDQPAPASPASASPDHEPSFIRQRPVRMAIYAGLAIFLVLMVVWPAVVHFSDPDFQQHIAQHRVMVGMSKEQVLQAWGGPQTINTSFTREGIRREEWIFEDWESAAIVKHRYLYFEEGTLIGGWYEGSGVRNQPKFPADSPHPKIQQ